MPEGDLPPDPMTVLAQSAAVMHEIYTAYKAAGFTDDQAFTVVITILGIATTSGMKATDDG